MIAEIFRQLGKLYEIEENRSNHYIEWFTTYHNRKEWVNRENRRLSSSECQE